MNNSRAAVIALRPRATAALVIASVAGLIMFFWPLFIQPAAGAGATTTPTAADQTPATQAAPAQTGATETVPAQTATATATQTGTTQTGTTQTAPLDAQSGAQTAPQSGTVALAVTDQGAKVLQPATSVASEVAANVSLDTIAYPSATEVQFGGRGTPGAFLRLYLNNIALGEAFAVGPDGTWNVTETGIEPKIYTLRVDEMDTSGKVTSRYETPFKRETPEALAAAMGTTGTDTISPAPAGTTTAGTTTATTSTAATAAATIAATPGADTATSDTPVAAGTSAGTSATQAQAPAVQLAPVTVTVQPGYTLWGIARRQMGRGILYVQVWNANKDKIRNPNLIYPGQVFALPKN